MKIMNYNPKLSFEATLVAPYTINRSDNMLPVDTSIVEVDIKNPNDITAVQTAVNDWGEGDIFGHKIADDLKQAHENQSFPKKKVYVLTSQNDHFEILEGENILGLSETVKKRRGKIEIKYLQVAPGSTFSAVGRMYSNIGKRLVNMLQEKHADKRLFAKVFYSAANFYEKMGFEILDPKQLLYVWKK